MATIGLYSSASALTALNTKLDVIANNLANVNTPGFKASRANFEDLLYIERAQPGTENAADQQRPIGQYIGLGVKVTGTQLDFAQGSPIQTGRPLDLTIEDYSNNEKISYLPRKLTEEGSGPFTNEAQGDLCYYAPWGNLASFHAGYRYSNGLIRLGRLDDDAKPLLTKGRFPLRIELIP